jgi:hypothetical protein
MSAHAVESERETAIATGCDEFDAKPIEFESLVATSSACLRTPNRCSLRADEVIELKRRQFITLLGGAAAAWPLAAHAQQAGKVARLGWLRLGSAADFAGRVEALRTGLRELGYVEGKDIVIEFRWPETVDQLSEFAAELVRMNVDIIFASSSIEVGAVLQVTKTILSLLKTPSI